MRPEPMAWPVGEVSQGWIGITTGPGGEELILAGDGTPLTEIEIGYQPAGSEAKLCGTVKLIWNSPTAASGAALAGIVTVPIVTVTPLKNVVEISVPAGDAARPGRCGFWTRHRTQGWRWPSQAGSALWLRRRRVFRPKGRGVLVQPEMERGRSPLVSIPPFGRDFQGIAVYRSDVVLGRGRKRRLRAPFSSSR